MLAGSLAALLMGFNAPSCLQCLNLHISATLPLQIDSEAAQDPIWDTVSYSAIALACISLSSIKGKAV